MIPRSPSSSDILWFCMLENAEVLCVPFHKRVCPAVPGDGSFPGMSGCGPGVQRRLGSGANRHDQDLRSLWFCGTGSCLDLEPAPHPTCLSFISWIWVIHIKAFSFCHFITYIIFYIKSFIHSMVHIMRNDACPVVSTLIIGLSFPYWLKMLSCSHTTYSLNIFEHSIPLCWFIYVYAPMF